MAKRTYYSRTAALIRSSGGGGGPRRHRRTIHIRWRVVLPIVIGVVLLAVFLFVPSFWWMDVTKFDIHGAPKSMHPAIFIASDLDRFHSISLDEDYGQTNLQRAYPDAQDIQVECRLVPASCDAWFTMRDPVVIWVTTERTMAVGAEPYIFQDMPDFVEELPVVNGPLPDGRWAESELRDALLGVQALRDLDVPVDTLKYDVQRGLVWVDEAGRQVAFGIGPDMSVRWDTYVKMLNYFESRNIAPTAIDVRFPLGVTYLIDGSW